MKIKALHKRFSIGYPPNVPYEDFKKFLEKYHRYIHDIYTSPIGEEKFHARRSIVSNYLADSPQNRKSFLRNLKLLRLYNIKFSLAVNTRHIVDEDIKYSSKFIKDNFFVDLVTILNKYYSVVKEVYPQSKLVYSFNNGILDDINFSQLTKYDFVVLGQRHIRNFKLFKRMHDKNIKLKLILDSGCLINCPGGCFGIGQVSCTHTAKMQIQKHGINKLYSDVTIMPFEFWDKYVYDPNLDVFKLNSRTSRLKEIEKCLDSYLNNNNAVEKYKDYISWGKHSELIKYYKYLDMNKILEYKTGEKTEFMSQSNETDMVLNRNLDY